MSLDLVVVIATALVVGVAAAIVAVIWRSPKIPTLGGRGRTLAELLGADAFGNANRMARLIAYVVCVAAAGFAVLVVFRHPVAMLGGVPLGLLAAGMTISHADKVRQRALDRQLPDAIDRLVSLVRGKNSLEASTKMLAASDLHALAPVFARVANRETLVAPLDEALEVVAKETVNRHIQLLFAALAVFCREGGNAVEPLQRMSGTFKQIMRLSEKIETASAQAWSTFRMINIAAGFIVATIAISQPKLLVVLTTTPIGIILAIVCASFWVLGVWLMQQTMKILI